MGWSLNILGVDRDQYWFYQIPVLSDSCSIWLMSYLIPVSKNVYKTVSKTPKLIYTYIYIYVYTCDMVCESCDQNFHEWLSNIWSRGSVFITWPEFPPMAVQYLVTRLRRLNNVYIYMSFRKTLTQFYIYFSRQGHQI